MRLKLLLVISIVILSLNCESSNSSVPSKDANVAVAKKKKAVSVKKDKLIGNWKHLSIAKTADGKGEPLKSASIIWTINEDGTGFYKKEDNDNKSSFKWELKNKNELILTPRGRGSSTTYTVVSKNSNKMVWENNNSGDYYIVEKQ